MKRFRHYLAVMLCISMLFCIMPAVNAATDTDYICSAVRFTDGGGNALTYSFRFNDKERQRRSRAFGAGDRT